MRQQAGPVTRFLRIAAAGATLAFMAACASSPPPAPAGGASSGGQAQAPAPRTRAAPAAGPLTVALLAPTTADGDRIRAAAQDLTAAAQMARTDAGATDLIMKIYDTRGTEAGAAEAARHAVSEGASVIIGPLLGAAANAAAPTAAAAGVNILSFSNDITVAGRNVWVLGQLPSTELERVMGYAASQGIGAIALAYPTNRYGEQIAQQAADAGRVAGVSVGPYLAYERSFNGIEAATQSGAADIIASGAGGVLIADNGDALRSVAAFLNYYDVSPRVVRFMGTSRWADEKNTTEDTLLGGWFAAADPAARAAFEARFEAEMGRRPSPLAAIGYDAMAAVAAMARDAGGGPAFDAASITRPGGFDGASGRFALTPDGGNRRGLAIFEVTRDGLAVIDPAPLGGPGA